METDCVEFKRSWRDEWLKWICAFANSEGGILYIGIDEKKREVVGVEDPQRLLEDVPNKVIASMGIAPKFSIEEREGKVIVVIEVAPASYPVSYHGEFHVRVGATKQLLVGPALTQFLLDKTGRKWDGVPLDGVTVEDLDRESFAIFRRCALETGRMAEADLNVSNKLLLEKLKLMVDDKLTRAAVLLFHPEPEKWVPSCYSKIGKFANNADLLFNDEIHGSLLVQAEKLVELLYLKYLIAPISYRDQTRIESYPYSKDAVRELVRNALMHQDFVNCQPVQLSVHPDCLYLGNAGGLPKGWKVGSLFKKHTSEARNELIAGALYRGGFVETWGRGIEKVCRECEKFGVSRPEYSATESDVMVCLHARVAKSGPSQELSSTPQESPHDAPHDTPHEKAILKALEMQALSAPELMQIVGVVNRKDFRTRILAPLLARQLVEMTLPDKPKSKNQAYRLTEKGKELVVAIERRGQPKTVTMVFDSHGRSRGSSAAPTLTTKNNGCVVEVYSLDATGERI